MSTSAPSARAAWGRRGAYRVTHRVAILAFGALGLAAAACDNLTVAASLDPAASLGSSSTTAGQSAAALVGRWTRVDRPAGGVTAQTEWTFVADGSLLRVVTTRSALGQVLAVDRATGSWSASVGQALLTLPGPAGGPAVTWRVPFAVDFGLERTVLALDGLRYDRADLTP